MGTKQKAPRVPMLRIGIYDTTDSFRSIGKHIAICLDDGSLVGVVGPAGDEKSKETAEAIVRAVNSYENMSAQIDYLAWELKRVADSHEANEKTISILRRMLEKATGWTMAEISKEIAIAQAEARP